MMGKNNNKKEILNDNVMIFFILQFTINIDLLSSTMMDPDAKQRVTAS
jgi:hypothetical protein